MGPWMDFIFARFLMGTNYDTYTVAIGLYDMLDKTRIETYCLQRYYVEGVTGGAVKG